MATIPTVERPDFCHEHPLGGCAQLGHDLAPLPPPQPWAPLPAPARVVAELPATKVARVAEDTRRRLARYTT